ncbi:MAG: hypothetical protein QM730_27940 [Anaerolineales bacterium]
MQNPGMLRDLSINGFGSAEQRIIRKLTQIWFVTFARQTQFKNSDFVFCFCKPTDDLIHRFHLSREVLVVFTPYNSFEPRVLDFVDKTIGEFQNRLDKLCVILISRDNEIRTKIIRIGQQDKELRIIVPFSYSELDSSLNSVGIVISRLKEFFYERDLFAFDSPLKNDNYFFGRSQTIQHLYGKYKSGENGCLFGLRRIGKTSALLAVKRYMAVRDEPAVFIDCSETSFHRRRWFEALFFLIQSAVKSLGTHPSDLHEEGDYNEKNASICFQDDLFSLHRIGEKRILFILDEIENITFDLSPSEHWAKDKDYIFFWQSLRSLFQKAETSHLFSVIIAGVNPKAVEIPIVQEKFDNPIYRFITPIYLPLFEANEVREMVSSIGTYMGLNFEDEVFTYLTDDFGGHPFLIRQVCSKIYQAIQDRRPFTVTKYYYQNEKQRLTNSIQDYIDLIVRVLRERYKDEYEMLEFLAQGDHKNFNEFVQMSHSMIEHLEGYGLIKEDRGKYHFRINAVEKYVSEHTKIAKVLNTREEKWKEITLQRNVLETNMRMLVKRILKQRYGPSVAKEKFLEIISKADDKARLNTLAYNDIFELHLYFDDLRRVIMKNWDDFAQIFNKDMEHFKYYSEFVNKHRIDAHANEIDDEFIGILLMALQWLRRQVDEYLD